MPVSGNGAAGSASGAGKSVKSASASGSTASFGPGLIPMLLKPALNESVVSKMAQTFPEARLKRKV